MFSAELRETFRQLGHDTMQHGAWSAGLKGIAGGWIVALMVWLTPSAGSARVWVIVVLAWLLAVSQLTHVIAGSVEALYLVVSGELALTAYLGQFLAPVLLGNTIGGVVLVAALNHAQVAAE